MYHYHQQKQHHHAPSTSAFSSLYYCNDITSRVLIPSIAHPVASVPDRPGRLHQLMLPAMINAHDGSPETRESTADYYSQYPVASQNTFNEDQCNTLSVIECEERKPRRNSQAAYDEHADVGNACGEALSRARYIKIRNDEDNYYNDNNNNYNDNGSSSNILIEKVKQKKKRT